MADTEVVVDESATDEQTAAPENDPDREILEGARDPDAVRNALQREREAAREAKRRADELEKRIAEFEDRDKTDHEKLLDRLAAAEKLAEDHARQRQDAELARLRYEVAIEKGLVNEKAVFAEKLAGTTKEEMAADADRLLKAFSGPPTGFDGGARGTQPEPEGMDQMIRRVARRG